MSDGISDSYRDQERGERYEYFLKVLAEFLEKSDAPSCPALEAAAKDLDRVPRGLITGRTNISAGLSVMVKKLREGDERTWGGLLLSAVSNYPRDVFNRLKAISPFKDKVLISVDYGCGFVTLEGEFESFLAEFIAKDNGLKVYDADDYLVAVDKDVLKNAKLVWLRCGIGGVKGPRKANEPSSNFSCFD